MIPSEGRFVPIQNHTTQAFQVNTIRDVFLSFVRLYALIIVVTLCSVCILQPKVKAAVKATRSHSVLFNNIHSVSISHVAVLRRTPGASHCHSIVIVTSQKHIHFLYFTI